MRATFWATLISNEKVEDDFPVAERAIQKEEDDDDDSEKSEAVIREGIKSNPILRSNTQNVADDLKAKGSLPDSNRVAEEEVEVDDASLVR